MAKTPKHIVLVGMIHPYTVRDEPDTEVWCVNSAFMKQNMDGSKKADRVYFMDDLRPAGDDFCGYVNAVKSMRFFGYRHWDAIPKSEVYPYDEVSAFFGGNLHYFTSTVAYMIAHAIFERPKKITLCGMYWPHDSSEYILAIPCLNMWCGIAMGLGITVNVMPRCMVLKPFPWQSERYGFKLNTMHQLSTQIMACSYRACLGLPVEWRNAEDPELQDPEYLESRSHMANNIVSHHEPVPRGAFGENSGRPEAVKEEVDNRYLDEFSPDKTLGNIVGPADLPLIEAINVPAANELTTDGTNPPLTITYGAPTGETSSPTLKPSQPNKPAIEADKGGAGAQIEPDEAMAPMAMPVET